MYSIGIKVNATRKTVSVSLFLYDLLPRLHVYTEVCKNILKVNFDYNRDRLESCIYIDRIIYIPFHLFESKFEFLEFVTFISFLNQALYLFNIFFLNLL